MRTPTAVLRNLSDILRWLLFFGLLWWALTGGDGWMFGIPSAVLATLAAIRLQSGPWRLRLTRLPVFIVFLLHAMLAGAWDVALRVLRYRCLVEPIWTTYPLKVDDRRVRYLTSLIIGLLPGTLVSRTVGDHLEVHVLDERLSWRPTVVELERQLALLLNGENA